jgi:hypothetical protein
MKLTKEELYDVVISSLRERPDDWTHTDHYHRQKRGVGIPYIIFNKKLDISIWLANGFSYAHIKLKGSDVGVNYTWFKKFRLYKSCMKLFIRSDSPAIYDLNVPLDFVRNEQLKKLGIK